MQELTNAKHLDKTFMWDQRVCMKTTNPLLDPAYHVQGFAAERVGSSQEAWTKPGPYIAFQLPLPGELSTHGTVKALAIKQKSFDTARCSFLARKRLYSALRRGMWCAILSTAKGGWGVRTPAL